MLLLKTPCTAPCWRSQCQPRGPRVTGAARGACRAAEFGSGPDSERGPASGGAAERPLPAGVHYVFDTALAADFSILEGQKEFVRRFHRHSEEEPALPMLTSACPGECQLSEAPVAGVCLLGPDSGRGYLVDQVGGVWA